MNRVVALMKAGCCGADDARALAARLQEIKPEGGTDPVGMLAWAVANVEAATSCSERQVGLGHAGLWWVRWCSVSLSAGYVRWRLF